jgi:glycosyltransferase involved in cell wall biosynthesis
MESPLVSIVVITYNQEKSLPKVLDCILWQKGGFSIEIIVGEDCSTDGTREVLKEYERRFPEVVKPIYQQNNQGILRNFISAISMAKGKYLAFCDGDDYWCDDEKLAKQIRVLEEKPEVGLVYSDVIMDSVVTGERYRRTMQNPKPDLFTQLLRGNIIVSSTVLMRSDLMKYVDWNTFVEQGFTMEDYPMWLSLSLHTQFYYLKEPLACYVIERKVVNVKEASLHGLKFDEGTTAIRLYFKRQYTEKTDLTENEILDAHNIIGYMAGLNMNDREFALKYVCQMHDRTSYVKRLTTICKSPLLFGLYQKYRDLTGKKRSPLEMYFGM